MNLPSAKLPCETQFNWRVAFVLRHYQLQRKSWNKNVILHAYKRDDWACENLIIYLRYKSCVSGVILDRSVYIHLNVWLQTDVVTIDLHNKMIRIQWLSSVFIVISVTSLILQICVIYKIQYCKCLIIYFEFVEFWMLDIFQSFFCYFDFARVYSGFPACSLWYLWHRSSYRFLLYMYIKHSIVSV